MIVPILGLGVLLSSAVEVAPGGSLGQLLDPQSRYAAIAGALPVEATMARAPAEPGAYWLAQWTSLDQPPQLTRFVIGAGKAVAERRVRIEQDRNPPSAALAWQPAPAQSELPVVGPRSRPQLQVSDRTAVASAELRVDGVPRNADNWSEGLSSGVHLLSVSVADVLDNRAELALGRVEVDLSGPKITLADPQGARGGWVGKPPYQIEASAEDAHGPVSLRIDSAQREQCRGAERLRCTLRKPEFTVIAEDGLGNVSDLAVQLKVDRVGPELSADSGPVRITKGRLDVRIGDVVVFAAEDNSGVVESGCARFGFSRCNELPARFEAVNRGRYQIRVEARDAFGNKRRTRFQIQVRR
jgi:hypothetical protein